MLEAQPAPNISLSKLGGPPPGSSAYPKESADSYISLGEGCSLPSPLYTRPVVKNLDFPRGLLPPKPVAGYRGRSPDLSATRGRAATGRGRAVAEADLGVV